MDSSKIPAVQIPESICPSCGHANQCAMAMDTLGDPSTCWCFSVDLTSFDRQALKDKFPADRCLCEACLSKLTAD